MDRNKSFGKLLETKLQASHVKKLIRVSFYPTTDGDWNIFPNHDYCRKVQMETILLSLVQIICRKWMWAEKSISVLELVELIVNTCQLGQMMHDWYLGPVMMIPSCIINNKTNQQLYPNFTNKQNSHWKLASILNFWDWEGQSEQLKVQAHIAAVFLTTHYHFALVLNRHLVSMLRMNQSMSALFLVYHSAFPAQSQAQRILDWEGMGQSCQFSVWCVFLSIGTTNLCQLVTGDHLWAF